MPTFVDRLKSAVYDTQGLFDLAKRVYRSRWINRQSFFQSWVLKQARQADAAIGQSTPSIIIETILTCNARCEMCVHSERTMIGTMPMPLFEKIIRGVAELGVTQVAMSGYGEPLLDKLWLERIKVVRAHGLKYSFISNASLLTPRIAGALLDMGGWEGVNFSINGFSKPVYERIMHPLKRDVVYRNVETFLEHMLQRGLTKPRVTVSCIHLRDNQDEWKQFIRYWEKKPGIARVVMGDFEDWLGELKKTGLKPEGIQRGVEQDVWLAPCPQVWGMMMILHDGSVLPCFADSADRKLVLGNANTHTLKEIFHGPAFTALRCTHKSGCRAGHAICGRCRLNYPWIS